MKIIWQKKASDELASIYKYIEKESPQNALMVFNGIYEFVNSLNVFPYKFPKEPTILSDNIRYAVVFTYKIVYAIENDTILILRVFNTKQNPKKLKK